MSNITMSTYNGSADGTPHEELRAVARDFYIYAISLLEVTRTRDTRLRSSAPNAFEHTRQLSDHTSRIVTTPNDDTLYSHAFIDLRQGPVTISVPKTGERYFSLALMDMYSNNFAYAGTRVTGGEAVELTLVGPDAPADGEGVVRAPTPWVWALARTLVDDEADLPAAHRVQNGLKISGAAGAAPAARAPAADAGALELLRGVKALMAENPPPAADAPILERFEAAGLDPDRIERSPELVQVLEAGFADAREFLSKPKKSRAAESDWVYPLPILGNFGTHYRYRAMIAMGGLAALEPVEAMYMRYVDGAEADPLDGRSTWRLHLDTPLPVNSFWSLALYKPEPNGNLYFIDNPLRRYSIGDRTKGLQYNADGTLDIWMSAREPEAGRSNWLPAPEGPFTVILRAYLPRAELLDGRYRLPPIEKVG